MSLEQTLTQTTGDTTPSPGREARTTARLLPVCCVCGLIRDELGASPDSVHWMTARRYRETYEVNPTEYPHTHTYCPDCFTKVQHMVRTYFRQIGA